MCAEWFLNFQHPENFKEPSYPVDDFGLEGADDAAVVEDWMFFIQFFKGRG